MTETTTPKRRGRPPGSKNKPKIMPAPLPPVEQTYAPVAEQLDFGFDAPADAPSVSTSGSTEGDYTQYFRAEVTSTPETPIYFVFQASSFGSSVHEPMTIDWPGEWPFPKQGERIVLADKIGGTVQTIEFDLRNRRMNVRLG